MFQSTTGLAAAMFLTGAVMLGELHAQPADDSAWQAEAAKRMRAIYETREVRGRPFRGEWLADGSGCLVWERDAETGRLVRVRYDVPSGERTVLPPGEKPAPRRRDDVSPDGTRRVEVHGRNLLVRDLQSDEHTRLTDPPPERDVWHRNPVWSPDGKRIVFVESDETDMRVRASLEPTDPSYPTVRNRRFARVGEKIESLRVGVVDVETQTTKWLPIEAPPEGFWLGQVGWAANSGEALVEKWSRFRDRREFLVFDVDSGDVRSLYEEEDDAWTVSSQEKNLGIEWLRDGKTFLVVSEKDGWRHAYVHSRDGGEPLLLTPGEYDVIDRAVVDEAGGSFYFYASPDNATQRFLYRVPLDGSGTLERITPPDATGTHEYRFSPDRKWALHTWSSFDTPPRVELVEVEGHRVVCVLEENAELREQAEKHLVAHPTEWLQLEIEEGVSLDAWLMKPRDFDPSKKYPLLVYVYGEPHAQTVLDQWNAGQSLFHRVVADLGYAVVSIDNRGTPAPKGAAWRRSVFGSLGPLSTEDQARGLRELGRTKPFVDLSRVAIWGWSGGGSNTLNALFRKPELYHVGIAVVPKPQPHLYYASFQEMYMRDRKVNPEGYRRSAPIHFAEGLKGDLLMITGSGETNTHIEIIEGLVDRLVELGKPFDYMVYPNRDHGLSEGPGTLVHVRMLIARYLVEHLPRGPR